MEIDGDIHCDMKSERDLIRTSDVEGENILGEFVDRLYNTYLTVFNLMHQRYFPK